jgi:poly-gamma-glutamate synthesis protein (capsule biosynthesis protein)
MPRLGFTGDVMLGRKVDEVQGGDRRAATSGQPSREQRQRNRPATAVWGDVLGRLQALDALFVNLECCLSTRGDRWTRTHRPFHFRADPDWAIPALEAAGVEWTNLANNHLMDYGEVALLDTLDHLDSAAIAHSGAGPNAAAAREPAVVEVGTESGENLRVAFVSATDNTPEFAAGEDGPGTAYVDLSDEAEAREELAAMLTRARRADPDLLVVSLHWGPNMVTEPPAHFRALGRWLAEQGVDLVHGHSAHVFQGVEVHDGTPLLYDCGDFVDDYAVDDDLRNDRSFCFEVAVEGGEIEELRLVPTEIYDCSVHEAEGAVAEWSRSRMRTLSAGFGTEFDVDGEALVLRL